MSTLKNVDVVQVSDFRLPGGTSSSIAEEVRTQSEAGLTTALIHTPSTVTSKAIPWSRQVRAVLDLPGVIVASPRTRLDAELVVFRHPTVAQSTPWSFSGIRTKHLVIVANHAAVDGGGANYDVTYIDHKLRELFNVQPQWAPIGPVVRDTILRQASHIPLRADDWVNIFRTPEAVHPRRGFVSDIPVIGRHSRPQPGKWPASAEDILAAYPDSDDYRVEILGGARVARQILGEVPSRWNVVPFGGEDPIHFLRRIDFWVYFHHPDLREAFGRAAMEALASGAVAIMPRYLEALFGDAALYGEPADVLPLIDSLWASPQRYLEQSERAQSFAMEFGPKVHLRRLGEFGIQPKPSHETKAATSPERDSSGARVLLITTGTSSNSAITRLERLASERASHLRTVLVAVAGMPPTDQSGHNGPVEYIASAEAMRAPADEWEEYLRQRLSRVVQRYKVGSAIFDGKAVPRMIATALRSLSLDVTASGRM